jgi:diamine N-acetyltransferase
MKIIPATGQDTAEIAYIVAKANKDVAEKFGLNRDNNPKHPSFYDMEWVLADFERGEEYFLYKEGDKVVGCVAFEQPDARVGYLNRLSVLPEHRGNGIGAKLVGHIFEQGRQKGVEQISIGIIAKHVVLKNWYLGLGFVENGLKEFPHLPFDVLFMKKTLYTG